MNRTVRVEDYARLDVERSRRTGIAEVVFAEGKSCAQTIELLAELRRAEPAAPALATRCPDAVLDAAPQALAEHPVEVDPVARTVLVGQCPEPVGTVPVLTAGTTDLPVAREALVTLRYLGVHAWLVSDVGVAGLHRLLGVLDELRGADCVIAVAGMDGAMPGVTAGLITAPVVGVPTSVGYGVAAGGVAAAATMLSACSPGLAVVNIDNGFGAAAHAFKILQVARRA